MGSSMVTKIVKMAATGKGRGGTASSVVSQEGEGAEGGMRSDQVDSLAHPSVITQKGAIVQL